MAGGKEIRTQISSIKSTQKITSAMEMVAASKMRKARERMELGKPYAIRIRNVVGHIANANPEYNHIYLQEREVKRVGFVVVSSDRGLCGGLNTNTFKAAVKEMKDFADQGIEIDLCLIGAKALSFFNSYGGNIQAAVRDIGEAPTVESLIGTIKTMLDAYADGKIDRLFLVANEFVNTMTQAPFVSQILPLKADEDEASRQYSWDYLYEPDAKEILDSLLIRYIESQVYQAVVENIACEQSARMLAMKSATDNAGDIIDTIMNC